MNWPASAGGSTAKPSSPFGAPSGTRESGSSQAPHALAHLEKAARPYRRRLRAGVLRRYEQLAGATQGDPDANPPHKRKRYFRIEYKRSAMTLVDGRLRLSNGKGNAPLVLPWPWELPNTVVIHWTGTEYEAIATYEHLPVHGPFLPGKVAGIDLGEVHIAPLTMERRRTSSMGDCCAPKCSTATSCKRTERRIDGRMKKGSKRRKRVIRSKKKQLCAVSAHTE